MYALVFPGQGSQSVGMGRELYDAFPSSKAVFEEADDALSTHLTRLMFEGDMAELTLTRNSQPAIMTVSIASLRALTDELGADISPTCCAGHSLGEYSALVASGVLSFWEAVRLVRRRGELMQEAVPEGEGSMAAVLGLDVDGVKALCEGIAPGGEVQAANYNSPGQVVISGLSEYIDKAVEHAKDYKAKRIVKLNVSAPFHSQYMKPAAEKLREEFARITWSEAKYDIIANVSAKPIKTPEEIQESLYTQTFNPVLWEQSVAYMVDEAGVTEFYELGTGEVLAGLVRRCRKGLVTKSGGTPDTLEEIRKCLQ